MNTTTTLTTTLLAGLTLLAACDSFDQDSALDDDVQVATANDDLELPLAELSDQELELLGSSPAAQTVVNAIYQCEVDVAGGSTNCDPAIVDANEFDPGEWTGAVHMDMDANAFRRMDIYAEICDPTLYALAIADSPTTNGWGGDSGTADHDAELHMYNSSMLFFSSVDVLHNVFATSTSVANAHAGGCQIVHTVTYHKEGAHVGVMGFDGGNGSPTTMSDNHGLKLDYVKCQSGASDPARGISCDYEDAARHDEKNWYFGLNRTVGSGSRDGTGVERACVVVSDDVSYVPANCLTPAPISVPPEGTRKMCIGAGTQAQMLADCESGAFVNRDLYVNGTWSTQDYISHWGDACPVGTSIVPTSQYYVANSCNPLPNVGAGCAGPGSYNWEFQVGVQCQ